MNESKMYDILFVGAGLHNAVFARLATDYGLKCCVIDKRDHIGGNIYDKYMDDINVHMYGAHIFHTNDINIWNFVNRYATFNNFINSPLADNNSRYYNLPFNMNTFNQLWECVRYPEQAKDKINKQRLDISEPKNLEEQALSLVGEDIYNTFIKYYTERQWGTECKNLPPDIIKRIPLRFTYNNNYFNDRFQGIPNDGYTNLIKNLFDGCDIKLNVNYFDNKQYYDNLADIIVYSGCIDQYFNYCYGELDYRSLRFSIIRLDDCSDFQGNAVINNTSKYGDYIRKIEHKHFDVQNSYVFDLDYTYITTEYPQKYIKDENEPYYPINDNKNMSKLKKYNKLANSIPNVIFGGRLAEYKYYDMDKVIKSSMDHFSDYIIKKGVN